MYIRSASAFNADPQSYEMPSTAAVDKAMNHVMESVLIAMSVGTLFIIAMLGAIWVYIGKPKSEKSGESEEQNIASKEGQVQLEPIKAEISLLELAHVKAGKK
ncbi:hypothetical protein GLAREA_12734 [Glarea lozoyensis ATCC 20868]|uniref:Uncharacterized protein n=1 Tax=Glarea lozoyensis (strain ATCC 20868 / MF5171) TaxID=1116229 RepID=S3DHC8_GLAL2|nr:uncharacterized protein GLAREA_12734 [Glarea lozoyensis ATCC 20868]EPE31431.1 hypothetical protein GLAREA_12734 [Glarea lozoyensis ATCC 20868]